VDDISRSFSADHRHCDDLFVTIEQAVSDGDWAQVQAAATGFIDRMERHFSIEEKELFPALLAVSAGAQGPVQVMQMEHEQMRGLFAQLQAAVEHKDARGCLDITETLLMTMQQHNMKEENVLYPLADNALSSRGPEFAQRMAQD